MAIVTVAPRVLEVQFSVEIDSSELITAALTQDIPIVLPPINGPLGSIQSMYLEVVEELDVGASGVTSLISTVGTPASPVGVMGPVELFGLAVDERQRAFGNGTDGNPPSLFVRFTAIGGNLGDRITSALDAGKWVAFIRATVW